MIRVHVSLRIPGTAPMPELIKLIQDVEAAGFDGAGILDSQLLGRDTFVTMGLAATHTSGLTLFPAVTNPLTRHVSTLASAIQTVEELAPGRIIPSSKGKTFPPYIPQVILDDYQEACSTVDLSPKASATLARRALQGILRDFSQVKPGRLVDEIEQIKNKVDPLTWDAIEAVRKIGNVGAHIEKDIVDVDPDEAALLIGLVETLLREWYIAREERKTRMGALVAAAATKAPKPTSPAAP